MRVVAESCARAPCDCCPRHRGLTLTRRRSGGYPHRWEAHLRDRAECARLAAFSTPTWLHHATIDHSDPVYWFSDASFPTTSLETSAPCLAYSSPGLQSLPWFRLPGQMRTRTASAGSTHCPAYALVPVQTLPSVQLSHQCDNSGMPAVRPDISTPAAAFNPTDLTSPSHRVPPLSARRLPFV